MAIVVGDEVALIRSPTTPTLEARGAVLFGIVISTASDNDIVWENGTVAEAVPSASLDKIARQAPVDGARVVTFNDAQDGAKLSPEYNCVVVRGYSRQPAGAGADADFVLMRSVLTGQLYEAPAAAVVPIDGA